MKNLKSLDNLALDRSLGGVVGDGLQAHHKMPRIGHWGTGTPAMFPSIGLTAKVRNSWYNGKLLANPAHAARHARDEAVERVAGQIGIGNPNVAAFRAGFTADRKNCD